MGYGIKFKIWGDYACFTRPELKAERVSYDMITPTAARGVLESIYWKPAIKWTIDKIHVINPIAFTNIRRNEVSEVASLSEVQKKLKGNNSPMFIDAIASRHQRATMLLKDVCYVIEAHFDLTDKAGESDSVEKHYNIALRRLREGKCFRQPCLGTRELGANFDIIENSDAPLKSSLTGELDLGYMLYDVGFSLDKTQEHFSVSPKFFRAKLVDGILDLSDVKAVE